MQPANVRQNSSSRQSGNKQKPRPLTIETQPLLERIEAETGHPIVVCWSSRKGSMQPRIAVCLLRLLQDARPDREVGVFLKSSGGDAEAALRVVHVLRHYYRRLIVYAPFICASAGTMVALGADEIQMGPGAFLTPVDTTLDHPLCPRAPTNQEETIGVSQDQFRRALKLWRENGNGGNPFSELYKYIHPAVIGELDRSNALSLLICQELLSCHVKNASLAAKIGRALCFGFPSHSYPIMLQEAQRMGLKAKPLPAGLDRQLRALDALYDRVATQACEYRDSDNYNSTFIPFFAERLGMQIYERADANVSFKSDLNRWVEWDSVTHCYEQVLMKRQWKTEVYQVA